MVWLAMHVNPHMPPLQTSPAGQGVPQAPAAWQYWLLVVGSTQAPPQMVWPAAHVRPHMPPLQTSPGGQGVPQAPAAWQYWLLVVGSTQAPPQMVWPAAHVRLHKPALQTSPAGHELLQVPQLPLSVCLLTHTPLHTVRPAWQERAHPPAAHT
jgi:hypothetical protein